MEYLKYGAILTCVLVFIVVVELVRRGRLKERYSIFWLFSSIVLLVISVVRNLLEFAAHFLGIGYPPSLIFLVAFLFLILISLHFSVVISGLSDKNKRLAQELALLKNEVEEFRNGYDADRRSALKQR